MRSACWSNNEKKLPSRGSSLPRNMALSRCRVRASVPAPLFAPRSGVEEDEIHRANHAQSRPQVIEIERLEQVEQREGRDHRERELFLDDLQLRHVLAGLLEADAVVVHLQ